MNFHRDIPTIEVIDDDPDILDSLNMLFKAEGYAVRTYSSARNFLEENWQSENGCIVTDVHMSELSGLDLLAVLADRHISLPVIVITGRSNVRIKVAAMNLGAFDFFSKPFDPDDLEPDSKFNRECFSPSPIVA